MPFCTLILWTSDKNCPCRKKVKKQQKIDLMNHCLFNFTEKPFFESSNSKNEWTHSHFSLVQQKQNVKCAEVSKYQRNILNIIFKNQKYVFVSKKKFSYNKITWTVFLVKNMKYTFGTFGSIRNRGVLGVGVPGK